MVTRTIISRFQETSLAAGSDRSISGGPLYPRSEVLALLQEKNTGVVLWSRKCQGDVAKLEFDSDDIVVLLRHTMINGSFRGSEWCTSKPEGPLAACDAYAVQRAEWSQYAYKELQCRYYVKFCIGKTGKILLVASCHLEENRRTK